MPAKAPSLRALGQSSVEHRGFGRNRLGGIRLRSRPPLVLHEVWLFRIARTQAPVRWTSAGLGHQRFHGSAVQEDQQRRRKA